MDRLNQDTKFKEAIGDFIIAFSTLEYSLVSLCSFTEFDFRNETVGINKYLGQTLENKLKHLTSFIKEQTPQFERTWDKIHQKIKQINLDRRHLVHGHLFYPLPAETITTNVKLDGVMKPKNFTIQEIKKITSDLYELISGSDGLSGHFHTEFIKERVDSWNNLVNDNNKIIYSVNNEIVSEYKGKVSA